MTPLSIHLKLCDHGPCTSFGRYHETKLARKNGVRHGFGTLCLKNHRSFCKRIWPEINAGPINYLGELSLEAG